MWKDIFIVFSRIIALMLIISGAVHGIIQHDYPHACFELILAMLCQGDLK